ncbi:hypothetical protein Pint_25213 [Pistacia integerrima]|uniref:Uncharacterized protein n=1 Tax=Pistacia integerrima TaxID=434235 RepID=A0ACC0YAS0_9ROSI|nr:hypothetical protein Pint_25213 [Pistacia integerrima]
MRCFSKKLARGLEVQTKSWRSLSELKKLCGNRLARWKESLTWPRSRRSNKGRPLKHCFHRRTMRSGSFGKCWQVRKGSNSDRLFASV